MDAFEHYEAGESGTPQGAVISPLLANLYLDPLDQLMACKGMEMVRYADDFVVLCHTQQQAAQALQAIQQWVQQAGLTLHPEKTRIVDTTQPGGFDFLGYHFEQGRKTPRKKSLEKFKERIRQASPRTSGQSMEEIIGRLTPLMRGWFNYFCHSRKWVFPTLDKWIRGRLRSILEISHEPSQMKPLTDRRAGCGRPARPVRREGRGVVSPLLPLYLRQPAGLLRTGE